MKLDAGTPGDMVCMNAPTDQKAWEKVMRGLSDLGSFEMQSMFVEGLHRNTSKESVAAWVQTVSELKPRSVQIYTIQRPPQASHVLPVALRRLEEIRSELEQATGIPAEVFVG
jgi:wyosine [tRNA(Phe)-imidazoG37] synthetase (radical SAM superfamily)